MLSASSGWQLSWTLCPVTRAQELDEAPTILLCFAVTPYSFYMLWGKGLEEPVHEFLKASLGYWHCRVLPVGSPLMICLNGRSQSLVLLWKHRTGFSGVSFLHLVQGRGEVRNSWVSSRSWNYLCVLIYQGGKHRKPWSALYVSAAPYHHLKYLIRQREGTSAVFLIVIS